jgi:hypothetical protein
VISAPSSKRILRNASAALVVSAAAVMVAAPSGASRGEGCRERGRTLVANERARVYGTREVPAGDLDVFACRYSSPRQRIYLDVRSTHNGSSRFKLAGQTVAFKVAGEGCSSGDCVGTYVQSWDIASNRRLQRIFGGPDRYVLKPNGSLAAAVLVNDLDPRLHLIRADRSGVQELAVDVDRGSLALARSRIYWTVAGVPQTATLD